MRYRPFVFEWIEYKFEICNTITKWQKKDDFWRFWVINTLNVTLKINANNIKVKELKNNINCHMFFTVYMELKTCAIFFPEIKKMCCM